MLVRDYRASVMLAAVIPTPALIVAVSPPNVMFSAVVLSGTAWKVRRWVSLVPHGLVQLQRAFPDVALRGKGVVLAPGQLQAPAPNLLIPLVADQSVEDQLVRGTAANHLDACAIGAQVDSALPGVRPAGAAQRQERGGGRLAISVQGQGFPADSYAAGQFHRFPPGRR